MTTITASPSITSTDSVVARIVAELEHNPDARTLLLRTLLTDDLLELPARVDRIEERLLALIEQVAENGRLIAENSRLIAENGRQIAENSRLIAENGRQIDALTQKVGTMDGKLGNLTGEFAERKVHANIHSVLAQHLQAPLRSRKILKNVYIDVDQSLREAIQDAAEDGLIDDAARIGAFATDIIVGCGRRGERENIYLVGEISRTINNDDITRAYERARTISVATGSETVAAAIGGFVAPPQTRLAEELGVRVFIVAQLQE